MMLTASMVVRNELNRYLPLAIEHLLGFCDGVCVLDDGSDDGTYEWLLERKGVQIIRNETSTFYQHEGRTRQRLLDFTLEAGSEYVLSIDADEFVGEPELLLRRCRKGSQVFTLQMEEVWGVDERNLAIRYDGQWKPRPCPILWRTPQNMRNPFWHIPQVQLACGREPLAVRRTRAEPSGASVFHFGWTNRLHREARFQRYAEHDGGRFHRDQHLQSILWTDDRVQVQNRDWPKELYSVREGIIRQANVSSGS